MVPYAPMQVLRTYVQPEVLPIPNIINNMVLCVEPGFHFGENMTFTID